MILPTSVKMRLVFRQDSQRQMRRWMICICFCAHLFMAASVRADWADILREENRRGKTKTAPSASKAAKEPTLSLEDPQGNGNMADGKPVEPSAANSINPVLERERKELERKMSVILSRIPDTKPEKGVLLSTFAHLYANLGEFGRAEKMSLKGVALAEKAGGKKSEPAFFTRLNLSKLYSYVGDYAKCFDIDKKNVEAIAANPDIEKVIQAACYAQLASTLLELGQLEAARANADKCLAIASRNQKAREHERWTVPLSIAGRVALSSGDREKTKEYLIQLLEVLEPALTGAVETKSQRVMVQSAITETRLNLAELYLAEGQNSKAEEQIDNLVAYYDQHPINKGTVSDAQLDAMRAIYSWASGRPEDATRHAKAYLQVHQKFLPNALTMAESQRLGWQERHLDFTLPVELCKPSELADLLLQWKGVVLESLMADRAANARKDGDLGAENNTGLADARRRMAQLSLMQSFGSEVSPELLDELKRKIDSEQKAEGGKKSSGPIADLENLLQHVQQSLSPDSALVEFVFYRQLPDLRFGRRLFGALVILPSGEPKWIPLGPVEPLEGMISDLDAMLKSSENSDDHASNLLSKIYGQVWEKIDESLPSRTSRIYISPDESLQFLPFACLLAADGRFISDRYGIVYVGSGRDLLRPGSRSEVKTISIFADPDFERLPVLAKKGEQKPTQSQMQFVRGADMSLPRLPGTALEAAEIQTSAGEAGWSSIMLLGADASEENLLNLPRVTILHLATHGFYLGDNLLSSDDSEATRGMTIKGTDIDPAAVTMNRKLPAMFASGLALSGAKETIVGWKNARNGDASDDGIITAEEILGLDLKDTKLVTLSACDTGAGEARSGEGVFGLRRAFMLAGCDNLLMSLWPVGDQITAEIMADFYRKAFTTKDMAKSFTETQSDWLERIRAQRGVATAVREAGPFVFAVMAASDVPPLSPVSQNPSAANQVLK
jgi:CHAT domain-containing protein